MVNVRRVATVVFAFLAIRGEAQDYQDYAEGYEQDNLYHDYAMRQQEKESTKGGGGFGKILLGGVVGWVVGARVHAGRVRKALNKKHQAEQKNLYTQYYNDVYTLQEQNAQLVKALEEMGVKLK